MARRDWTYDPEVKISIRSNHEKVRAMTDPAPSVQPVRAWAVVDKDGKIKVSSCCHTRSYIETLAEAFDKAFPASAPHRGIRVEIREVNDE